MKLRVPKDGCDAAVAEPRTEPGTQALHGRAESFRTGRVAQVVQTHAHIVDPRRSRRDLGWAP